MEKEKKAKIQILVCDSSGLGRGTRIRILTDAPPEGLGIRPWESLYPVVTHEHTNPQGLVESRSISHLDEFRACREVFSSQGGSCTRNMASKVTVARVGMMILNARPGGLTQFPSTSH